MSEDKNPHGIKKGQVLWYVCGGRHGFTGEVTVTAVRVSTGKFYANDCKFRLENLYEVREYGQGGCIYLSEQAYLDECAYQSSLKHIANATGVGKYGTGSEPKINQDQAKRIMAILKENEETKNHQ